MSKNLIEIFKAQSKLVQGVVIVGGLTVVYIFASQIIKKIKEDAQARKDEANLIDSKAELGDLINKGVNPTFSVSQYKAWADSIQQQFDGCDLSSPPIDSSLFWSNSMYTLFNIITKFKNDSDFLSLVNAYDTRTVKGCLLQSDVSGDIYKAVSDELNKSEIQVINDELAKNGITKSF